MGAWQRRKAAIIGVAALAVVATGLVVGISASRSPTRPATVAATITIDPNIGETFAPAPTDAAPKLTALGRQPGWWSALCRIKHHCADQQLAAPSPPRH